MEFIWFGGALILGFFFGFLVNYFILVHYKKRNSEIVCELKKKIDIAREDIQEKNEIITDLSQEIARLETTVELNKRSTEEKIELVLEAKEKLGNAFKSISNEVLRNNNQSFLTLAKTTLEKYQSEAVRTLEEKEKAVSDLVRPIKHSLTRVNDQIEELEKARLRAYGSLSEQIKNLIGTQNMLSSETRNLVRALRAPNVRGRWGEIRLKRVVEISGMLEYCDFYQQKSVHTDDGRLRPDLIVRLPGGKHIVVDAKAPLQAYLDALEVTDEKERILKIKEHANQIRNHINSLSSKSYWEQFQPTPEFVILFLPGESFFSAALEQIPSLIEEGVRKHIILATPTTLISLLRSVHYGWRQERVAENAHKISLLGQELHERIATMSEHLNRVGASISKSVEAYNASVASFEGRVLGSARKFKMLGAMSKKDIEELSPIDKIPRAIKIIDNDEQNSGQVSFEFEEK